MLSLIDCFIISYSWEVEAFSHLMLSDPHCFITPDLVYVLKARFDNDRFIISPMAKQVGWRTTAPLSVTYLGMMKFTTTVPLSVIFES